MLALSGGFDRGSSVLADGSTVTPNTSTTTSLAGSVGYRHWLVRSDQAPVGVSLWAVGLLRYAAVSDEGSRIVPLSGNSSTGGYLSGGVELGLSVERFLTQQLAVRIGTSLVKGEGRFERSPRYTVDASGSVFRVDARSTGFNISAVVSPSVELRLYF